MPKYPKHDHVYAPVTHQTVAPDKTTGTEREFISWSQCGICGAEDPEVDRPDEAPPSKETVYKGEVPS